METQGNTSKASTYVENNEGMGEAINDNNIPPMTNSAAQGQNHVNDAANEVEQVCGKRKFRSPAWNHFKKIRVNGEEKAECNYCQSRLVAKSSSGTKHLLDHFGRCLKRPFRDIRQHILVQEKKNADGSPSSFLSNYTFNAETSRRELAEMIIVHEYPLSMVEHHAFRKFVKGPSLSASSGRRLGFKKLLSNIANIARQQDDSDVTNELENYYRENLLPTDMELDLLSWWKTNGFKYPTLERIARDILAIPISTVASESAFSTSGRLISPHRSRLRPKTLEALMCAQSWLLNEIRETCPDDSKKAYCRTVEYDYDDDEECTKESGTSVDNSV